MNIEAIQQALFSAYDIKYNLNMAEKCRVINQDSGELLIDALNEIIETLEQTESYIERQMIEDEHKPDCPAVDGFGCRCNEGQQ